jgi:hypothetical protein
MNTRVEIVTGWGNRCKAIAYWPAPMPLPRAGEWLTLTTPTQGTVRWLVWQIEHVVDWTATDHDRVLVHVEPV